MAEWQTLVDRTIASGKRVPWSTGADKTIGHLARIDGKYFFAQVYANGPRAGELATAFVPTQAQLGAIFEKTRELTMIPIQAPFLDLAFLADDPMGVLQTRPPLAPELFGLSDGLEEVVVLSNSIVALRREGEAFCGAARRNRRRLMTLGADAYRRFVQVASEMDCVYGAILVEYALETPAELRRDPRSLAFRDFFLNQSRIGTATIDECVRIAGRDAYVAILSRGVYISMSKEFNPGRKAVEHGAAQWKSCETAIVLARAVP